MKNEMIMTESVADNTEYFAQRQLKKGAVGWLLLVGLGVSYVISGDFAGWNFGIAQGGWGGLFKERRRMKLKTLTTAMGLF